LGIKSVPVMIAEGWTDAQKRAYVIADNKLALNSGWDEDVLAMELGDLSSEEFDLSVIGFSAKALDEFLAADALDPTMPDLGPKKMISAHTCPACGHQWVEDDE
jgi:ParB-like chromosome segregation protein Spo0J